MKTIPDSLISRKETIFQVLLYLIVLIFYLFDRNHPRIELYRAVFFANYALAAVFINYVLLPRFYYQKKNIHFVVGIMLVIASVIVIEELVLEPIYLPGRRATNFPGILFTLAQVMPVVCILVGFKFGWDALSRQKEVEQLQTVIRDSELQFLKSQINPHFLFNNLNNLYSYAIENSPKTPDIILQISGLLRYMLYECKGKYVSLDREVEQLRNFIDLHQLQIEDRGQVSFTCSGTTSEFRIAPLILIVFVENAFKHSTASQSQDIIIEVNLNVGDEGKLKFRCKNSFQSQSNTENLSQGIGLENVKKRLLLLYPNTHELSISKKGHFFEVLLSMKLLKSD